MKVHFASGTHPFPGWTNVDAFEWPGCHIDLVADLLGELPKQLVDIEIAYVGHFLEHLTPEEGVAFLEKVRERTSPGGQLVIVGPDAVKGQTWFDEGRLPKELLSAIKKHGSIPEDNPNNRAGVHLWDCSGAAVVQQCQDAGWISALEIPLGKLANTLPDVPIIDATEWQFCVIATK